MSKTKRRESLVWAPLPGSCGIMWPVLYLNEESETESSVFCNCDKTEFIVKSSKIVSFRDNYHLRDSGTKYLKKKKKYNTLNCFLSDLRWIEEMPNQSSSVKKRRLQDSVSQESSNLHPPDLPPPTTQPDFPPPTSQPILPQATTQTDLPPHTAQPDLLPPTTQPDLQPPTTQPDLKPSTSQTDLPPSTTQADLPPAITETDSPPAITQPDLPPPTTQTDLKPSTSQTDLPPPTTQADLLPAITQTDSPPAVTQPDLPLPTTRPGLLPLTTQPDLPPPTAEPDLAPTTQPHLPPPTTQDLPPVITKSDLPPPTAQPDLPPPTTQPDLQPPTTQPDLKPSTSQTDLPTPTTRLDIPPPTTQTDLPPAITQPDLPPPTSQTDFPRLTTRPNFSQPIAQPGLLPQITQPDSPLAVCSSSGYGLSALQSYRSSCSDYSDELFSADSPLSKSQQDSPPAVSSSSGRALRSALKSRQLSYSDYSDDLVSSGSEYVPEGDSCDEDKSRVSDSCSSPESEVFPMLSQKPISTKTVEFFEEEPSKAVCEEWTSDDEDVNEEEITRASDNSGIYVFKILKSSTTKSGKKKKVNRVYNNYQYCALCKKKVSNFSQHISRNRNVPAHAKCKELSEILEDKDKHSRNRRCTLLRSKFNHEFNMKTLQRGKGELILERRPVGKFELKEYGPCPGCYMWLSHKLMRKHKSTCLAKCDFTRSASLITQSKIISGRIQTRPSQTLLKEVFSTMNMDAIGTVAREDPLIVQLGNQWIQKNVGNRLKRGTYTAQIMRLCARLLINLRELTPLSEEPILWNYLKASFFDDIVRATLKTANAISEDNLENPSNARKLGFDIKKMINGKIGISIMTNDETSRKDAEDLLKTMEIFWGTRVAKLSNVLLEERKYDKHQKLPNPDDIAELNKSLECSIKGLDLKTTTFENFTAVVEAVEAKLVIYNRRRVGELEAIRLTDYENRRKGEAPEHLMGELSEFEKKLLREQEVMTVRGKTGRGVPVILPAITKPALSFLTDKAVRIACGISPKNVYIFAGKGEGVIRAYNSVLKACSKAQLISPELITSTSLRKYMATITQVFDLKPNEMNWVLDHLGHSMDVHKIHYRSTSEILEKTQIAKLLLLQDSNRIGEYKNMSLKDIHMEDVACDKVELTEEFDKEVFTQSLLDSDYEEESAVKSKRRPAISVKIKWTPEEEEEIKKLFKKSIEKKKRPTPAKCQKALEESKRNGGVLWKRKKDVLKKKMFRIIDKLNKK